MTPDTVASQPTTNRFDRMEIAGAFGDLGTLIPFVVAYLAVLKMDPFGVLFAFGISACWSAASSTARQSPCNR